MSTEVISKIIDDLVLSTLNNSVVTDLNNIEEIETKHRNIVHKKNEVIKQLSSLLITKQEAHYANESRSTIN